MRTLYASPLRVYLLLALIAVAGIFSGTSLPISLFPNSTKPIVYANLKYGSMSATEFLDSTGRDIETGLRAISAKNLEIEKLTAEYSSSGVEYHVEFKWNSDNDEAISKVRDVVSRYISGLSQETRQSLQVYPRNEGGFFAASYYSSERDLTSLYETVESVVGPELGSVTEAGEIEVWNPARKELQIELRPEILASLQLLPSDIARAILPMLESYNGGSIQVGDKQLSILIPKRAFAIADFGRLPIVTPKGTAVQLKDVAKIDLTTPLSATRVVKTSGAASVLVYATPKIGGNIKKMSEDIIQILEDKAKVLPKDIQYKLLVDPSEFIRSAINNVLREVFLAAGIAVVVLFLFIGSLKNVATAAIEIPLSIVMAFIFMRLSGMNLNVISLGGLALSAGMNVDASVVVMENIFRHFEHAKDVVKMSFEDKLDLVVKAVDEVKLPVIASTIASLVVFLPLIFTGGLSAAILSDLAKAVLFSHGLSAVVALILVPTIRLQMLKTETTFQLHSPIERILKRIENTYVTSLEIFLRRSRLRLVANLGLVGVLIACAVFVAPRIPQEIIGRPDSDWMILVINSQGNSLIRQMEGQAEELEAKALTLLGDKVMYTFTQVNQVNRANVMLRLKDKRDMSSVWKLLEAEFSNTPQFRFFIVPWNPSELPLPNPPHLKISFRGGTPEMQATAAQEFNELLESKQIFPRVWSEPDSTKVDQIRFEPTIELAQRNAMGGRLNAAEVADFARVATKGKVIGQFPFNNQQPNILLKFPDQYLKTIEDLEALPVGTNEKILPLKSFAKAEVIKTLPVISRENERSVYSVLAKQNQGQEDLIPTSQVEARALFDSWRKDKVSDLVIKFEEPNPDLKSSIHDLGLALAISIGLILITMVLQMGSVVNSLLVFVAVPLGLIGAILSLYIFQSSISLNSLLGIILLSGIAVANSIILVDFLRRMVQDGMQPEAAALAAARTRLRPILMTTLTTSLGMLPIALGHGEGGKILQPLGIVVSGGIFVSMLLTLFIVPGLQVQYLNFQNRRARLQTSNLTNLALLILFCTSLLRPAHASAADEVKTQAKAPRQTFESVLKALLEEDETVKVANSKLRQSQEQELQTAFQFLPDLSASANQGRRGDPKEDFTAQKLTSTLNLFRFGADLGRYQAAYQQRLSQEAFAQLSYLDADELYANLLLNYVAAAKQVSVARRNSSARENFFSVATTRFQQGYLSKQELDKVEIDLANATARLSDAELALQQLKLKITNSLKIKDAAAENDSVQWTGPTEWPWISEISTSQPGLSVAPDSTSRSHPAVKAYELSALSLKKLEASAARSIFPSLDLSASLEWDQVRAQETRGWSGMVTLSIPLFNKRQDYSNYRIATEARIQAEQRQAKAIRELLELRQSAEIGFQKQKLSALAREKTLSISQRLFADNLRRFQAGRASVNDLLLDQDRLNQAELLAIEGWRAAHASRVQLLKSRGLRLLGDEAMGRSN